jgi:hypothetical protein
VHGERQPLLLDERGDGVLGGEQSRQLVTERLQAAGRLRGGELAGVGVPPLVAVLAHHDQPGAPRERVGDLLETAELDDLAGRAAGHDHDGADLGGEVGQDAGPVRVDHRQGGVLDDRRQRPVEVQADDHVARDGDQPVVPLLRLCGAELHAPSMPYE